MSVDGNVSHAAINGIEKLRGAENYPTWKYQMKMLLTFEGLWKVVEGTDTDATRDGRALARIGLSVTSSCYQHIRDAESAEDAWTNLKNVFENKGLFRRVLLLRQLHRMEYNQFNCMSLYIENVMGVVHQLADIDKIIEDSEIAELLLSGLPEEYDALVSNLETACITNALTSELVRARLLQEESRKKKPETSEESAFFSGSKTRPVSSGSGAVKKREIICHYCNKAGHVKAKCFKWKRDKKNDKKFNHSLLAADTQATAFFVKSGDWYIDSGCSNHMCNDKNLFVNYEEFDGHHNNIMLANNQKITAEGIGEVKLKDSITIEKVLFVPNLSANLLSVSRLTQKGFTVIFNRDSCNIYKNCEIHGNPIFSCKIFNGLYKWDGCSQVRSSQSVHSSMFLCNRQEIQSANVAASVQPAELWHKRLGHLGFKGMCALKDGLATGVMFQVCTPNLECETCLLGKQVGLPFPAGEATRATKPLEIIHSDVAGPMQQCSFGGAKYLVTFTDDYTRKTYGYLLKRKSEVMHHFIIFKNEVEKQLGLPIKILRSDNGSEYCNSKFDDFLKKEGIIHQKTVPYCPQQNGVSERLNRTLMEKARCLMLGAGLCTRFWGEAVMSAIYLKNRSPTAALAGHTPEGLWTGSKPDLGHLHVFGCIAYSLIPKEKRQKLDARSKMYIFVGYSETTKGYRLLDPLNPQKVILSRNVKFLENKFYKDFNKIKENDMNDFIFYEFDIYNNENFNNNDNLNNNINPNGLNNFVNSTSSQMDKSKNSEGANESLVLSGSSEEDFCTGDEDDDEGVRSTGSMDSFHEPVVLSGEPSSAGEVCPMPPASPIVRSSRPVRSTRSKPPLRYKDYVNDFSLVARDSSDVHLIEPQSYKEAISSPNSAEWVSAMKSEYDSLMANQVWTLVDRPLGVNVIKSKWVYKIKKDASGNFDKFKARLVAMGFTQVHGVDYEETFSPVVRKCSLRILFALACELDLSIDHIDVTTAFLNGELRETIYMEQPPGFDNNNKGKVCLLKKGIYGLKQASKIWYDRVNKLLCENGFSQSKCEPCIYTSKVNNCLVIVALYVDDFYIFYNNELAKDQLVKLLMNEFNCKNLGNLKSCIGINVTRGKDFLKLDQSDYVKRLLKRFGMENCKPVSTPMMVNCKFENNSETLCDETYEYRELMGCLMYLSVCTRPDISFACSQLSQYNTKFNRSHWLAAKRILRYLAGTIDYALHFTKTKEFCLTAYADADWANDPLDRRSYTGFVVKLGGNTINWESRKQRCVALSSTEAEYLCINDVCKDICFIKNFMLEVLCMKLKTVIYNDNQSAHKLVETREHCHKRTKHIDIRYHFIKDLVHNHNITIKYLPTEQMIADVLTKPLSANKHSTFVHGMNVR